VIGLNTLHSVKVDIVDNGHTVPPAPLLIRYNKDLL
jgi:hypothetical protein